MRARWARKTPGKLRLFTSASPPQQGRGKFDRRLTNEREKGERKCICARDGKTSGKRRGAETREEEGTFACLRRFRAVSGNKRRAKEKVSAARARSARVHLTKKSGYLYSRWKRDETFLEFTPPPPPLPPSAPLRRNRRKTSKNARHGDKRKFSYGKFFERNFECINQPIDRSDIALYIHNGKYYKCYRISREM